MEQATSVASAKGSPPRVQSKRLVRIGHIMDRYALIERGYASCKLGREDAALAVRKLEKKFAWLDNLLACAEEESRSMAFPHTLIEKAKKRAENHRETAVSLYSRNEAVSLIRAISVADCATAQAISLVYIQAMEMRESTMSYKASTDFVRRVFCREEHAKPHLNLRAYFEGIVRIFRAHSRQCKKAVLQSIHWVETPLDSLMHVPAFSELSASQRLRLVS